MVHGLEVEIGGHLHVGAAEGQDAQAEVQQLQGHQWDLGGVHPPAAPGGELEVGRQFDVRAQQGEQAQEEVHDLQRQEGQQVLLPVLDHANQQAQADDEEHGDKQEAGDQFGDPEVARLRELAGGLAVGHLH